VLAQHVGDRIRAVHAAAILDVLLHL
jgi:hypothetical protein